MTIWVILWREWDNSGFGVVERAFADEEEAKWQVKLLTEASSRYYAVTQLELKQ